MFDRPADHTLLFAGGGTGGHLFPGIAVADELRRRDARTRVVFVGSEKPLERQIVDAAGYEHVALPAQSPSMASSRLMPSLMGNWRAYRMAREWLSRQRPCVVVGLGGFASVPPVLAAWRGGVPIVLLEQNVVPGKATRWLSRLAEAVCLPWDEAALEMPTRKSLVTGNPIRREIAALTNNPSATADVPPTLLILGGSQGATALNGIVLETFASLRSQLANWQIVHQTGAADVEAVRRKYSDLSLIADVVPFVSDMAALYRRATVVISRAGATTLAELACAGTPAILIPLPTSAHDHQRRNAKLFADRGAAVLVEQASSATASSSTLTTALQELLGNVEVQAQRRQAMRQLARPQAAELVADRLQRWFE